MILSRALNETRLAAALRDLNARIERGEEFPDASTIAALRYCVDYDALREAYDAQEVRQ
jgi:hypothetical protein